MLDALQHTVSIRDSALGLSGFVSFFWWAYMRGVIHEESIVMLYGPILLSSLFRGVYLRGGAITDSYGIRKTLLPNLDKVAKHSV